MTIKQLETILGVPRATIRFYEKEGLIVPKREENGYRTYSDENVELLKKIIILRKIGLPVNEISDLLDGAITLQSALDENVKNIEKQIDELRGAMNLSRHMMDAALDISTLDTTKYWNEIEEEEKKGNRFLDIAKDIAHEEKKVILRYIGFTDENGQLYDPLKSIVFFAGTVVVFGLGACWINKEWTLDNFFWMLKGVIVVVIFEIIMSLPLYFLGRKIPWIANNRNKALMVACGIMLVILIFIIVLIQ